MEKYLMSGMGHAEGKILARIQVSQPLKQFPYFV
jgi:hypothetical protein